MGSKIRGLKGTRRNHRVLPYSKYNNKIKHNKNQSPQIFLFQINFPFGKTKEVKLHSVSLVGQWLPYLGGVEIEPQAGLKLHLQPNLIYVFSGNFDTVSQLSVKTDFDSFFTLSLKKNITPVNGRRHIHIILQVIIGDDGNLEI